jgi:hypothetical protein
VTGTIGFDGLTSSTGAGSLCLDSNKQVVYNSASDNCLSSTRATKHDIAPLSLDDLGVVERLEPVSFVYNEGDGRTRYGFIAEDTAAVDARLATYNASGTVSGIDDRSILAILVGAFKELATTVRGFAVKFTSNEIHAVNRLCIGETCINENQLKALLSVPAAQTAAGAATASDGQQEEAPSGSSATEAANADAATTTTPVEATSTPPASPANDDEPPTADSEPAVEEVEGSVPEEELAPANDNEPVEDLPLIAD